MEALEIYSRKYDHHDFERRHVIWKAINMKKCNGVEGNWWSRGLPPYRQFTVIPSRTKDNAFLQKYDIHYANH